ncbi:MAG TPA: HD domain-containing phosphohydrolase [Geobacteraceae bacterium]|nr:HD domain-containing phosphohydrolase [Geobacteraceae bacterium]
MPSELCDMSLRQTQELLRLTDYTLQNICCRRYTSEELYEEALRKVLGAKGRRGPRYILLVFKDMETGIHLGRVFNMKEGEMAESEEITFDPGSAYAIDMAGAETVISNWCDVCETVEEYQDNFHPVVKAFVGGPVKNFVCNRISGDRPGMIIALNYPGVVTEYDADVLRSLSVVIGSLVTISNEMRETEKAFIYTIEALARACEAAEEETGKHVLRVNRYAGALAANMGLPAVFIETISYSAQMHDVGKIKIPNSILLKEGPLDRDEMKIMMMHPAYGEKILGDSPRLSVARQIAISHHENWDGSGYPRGLKGDKIPLAGRIVKLADVYDALRSKRSYKHACSHSETLSVFSEGDERVIPALHFDPEILKTFFRIEHIFESIYESLGGVMP